MWFRKAAYSKIYEATRSVEFTVELKWRSIFRTVFIGTFTCGRIANVSAVSEITAMQVLARCFVIHALYFVGRKTAIKLSKAKANTIPKETLNESRENEEPTLAI